MTSKTSSTTLRQKAGSLGRTLIRTLTKILRTPIPVLVVSRDSRGARRIKHRYVSHPVKVLARTKDSGHGYDAWLVGKSDTGRKMLVYIGPIESIQIDGMEL